MSFPLCGEASAVSTFDIPALKMNVFDFLFIWVWHLSNISAQFLFRECLCTQHMYGFLPSFWSMEKSLAQLIPKLSLKWNLETQRILSVWPANLTFWIQSFRTKFLPRQFFSGDIHPFKSHIIESKDENMHKLLFSFLSSVSVREEGSQFGEFSFIRVLWFYLSSFSPNNSCENV